MERLAVTVPLALLAMAFTVAGLVADGKPDGTPGGKPDGIPGGKPDGIVGGKPDGIVGGKPDLVPGGKPDGKPDGKLVGDGKPDGKLIGDGKLLGDGRPGRDRKDDDGNNLFSGGFLGLDNIGVFDRSAPLPTGGHLEQADGTAWMATLIMHMLEMTVELAHHDPTYIRMFGRWTWDAWLIASALENGAGTVSFWNEDTGFYHDVIEVPDGSATSLEVFSMQGVVPLFAGISIPVTSVEALKTIHAEIERLKNAYEIDQAFLPLQLSGGDGTHVMIAIVGHHRLARMLERLLDEALVVAQGGVEACGVQDVGLVAEAGFDGGEPPAKRGGSSGTSRLRESDTGEVPAVVAPGSRPMSSPTRTIVFDNADDDLDIPDFLK